MVRIGTYCSDCCFYNNFEKKCQHNILDIFEKDGSNILWDEAGPCVDRICQYKRLDEWVIKNNITNTQDKIALCKSEIYLKGTVILLADNLDSFINTINKLNRIENINYSYLVIY